MRCEAVAQRVGMDWFLDACALGSLLTGVPRCFRIDGLIAVVPNGCLENSHSLDFLGKRRQCSRSSSSSFWAEHHISVSASLATLDVNHHPLAVDVADFQVCQLGVAHSSCVERQQQNAMVGSERCIDKFA